MTDLNTMTPLTCGECGDGTYMSRPGNAQPDVYCTTCGHEVNLPEFDPDENEVIMFDRDGVLCVAEVDPCGAYPPSTRCLHEGCKLMAWPAPHLRASQGRFYTCNADDLHTTLLIDSCECSDEDDE